MRATATAQEMPGLLQIAEANQRETQNDQRREPQGGYLRRWERVRVEGIGPGIHFVQVVKTIAVAVRQEGVGAVDASLVQVGQAVVVVI